MKKVVVILLACAGFFLPLSVAADLNCTGNVIRVMDYPVKCDGNTAFITSASNGKWICSTSDNGNAIVLTALAAEKTVVVNMDSENDTLTCQTLPHYKSARYIIMHP